MKKIMSKAEYDSTFARIVFTSNDSYALHFNSRILDFSNTFYF
jgi:hypothetical protein